MISYRKLEDAEKSTLPTFHKHGAKIMPRCEKNQRAAAELWIFNKMR